MSSTIGVFVDTSDLYHRIRRKFNSAKLCYETYFDKVANWGTIQQSFAYGMQTDNEASGFITCLKMIGFDVRFKRPRIMRIGDREIKKCDWGVQIVIDIVKTISRLDTIVLGVSNPDFIPLVQWIRDQGVRVTILASCIPKSLRDAADNVIEIDRDLLEVEEASREFVEDDEDENSDFSKLYSGDDDDEDLDED